MTERHSLKAFHSSREIKDKYIARVRGHRERDNIVQVIGWENGRDRIKMRTSTDIEHEQERRLKEWLDGLPPDERDAALDALAGSGSSLSRKDSAAGSEVDASWLGTEDVDGNADADGLDDDQARLMGEVLARLVERREPGLDILCLCVALGHPGAAARKRMARKMGVQSGAVMARGRRVAKALGVTEIDFGILEILLWTGSRRRPRMTLRALMRAVGCSGAWPLDAIAAEAGVTKQNVLKEERAIQDRYALGRTALQRGDKVKEGLRISNFRKRRVDD